MQVTVLLIVLSWYSRLPIAEDRMELENFERCIKYEGENHENHKILRIHHIVRSACSWLCFEGKYSTPGGQSS